MQRATTFALISGVHLAMTLAARLDLSVDIPSLHEGDKFACDGKVVTLGKKIGEGNWGQVFINKDKRYAVKVETQTNTDDKFWHLKDISHECKIMRELESVDGINVPKCVSLCKRNDLQVMVMDMVQDAKEMNEAFRDKDSYDMYKIGNQVYKAATAMLSANIVNVDQDSKNILVSPSSDVYFIDMGMAEKQSEVEEMLGDAKYAKKYGIMTKFADLGSDVAAAYQVQLEYSSTASAAVGSLSPNSLDAMRGMVDAFCEDTHSELTTEEYYVVSASSKDKGFLQAFKGETDFMGDIVGPPLLEMSGGLFVKVDDRKIKVKVNGNGRKEEHSIPKGATLVGVKCASEYKMTDMTDFNPVGYTDDLCEGLYYFKVEGFEYITDTVMSLLKRAGSKAEELKNRAQNCR